MRTFLIVVSFLALLLNCLKIYGQLEFGQLTADERELTSYPQDTTATAVYLSEVGKNYFEVRNGYVWLISEYSAKIKILKPEGVETANISIPLDRNSEWKETLHKLRAVTHNGTVKKGVTKEDIYEVDINKNRIEKRFTFPDVQVGSVLEYTYEIKSPFFRNLNGWKFQSEIPKIRSEYHAKIPGNYVYNRALIGALKLNVNEASIKRNCFTVPGASEPADCEVLKYVMKQVPAFDDEEAFMLSGDNYRSRLEFEMAEYLKFNGGRQVYTKTWKDVDREFRKDPDIGSQLRKKNFFEKRVPPELLTEGTPLEKAQNIYAYVQNHFAWNEQYGLWNNNRVKQAFDERKGSAAEINITLINLLNAAGIKANMMLMATRAYALPKISHPVMNDFKYVIAKATIGEDSYLLDASDRYVPFGMLPYRCLNYYGRVMDFDTDSYWQDIIPTDKNKKVTHVRMELEPVAGKAKGFMSKTSTGYYFINRYKTVQSIPEEEYLISLEESIGDDFYITSYEKNKVPRNTSRITEKFGFEIEGIQQNGDLHINPFLIKSFETNPFKASVRNFPIDFGFKRSNTYTLNIKIPEGYKVKFIPEQKAIALPESSGMLKLECRETNGFLSVFYHFELKATQYTSDAYDYVKQFFQEAVDIQGLSYIVLEKA
ncbi:MAG: DUF3857 and transglutaminase domain-containing protein [Bacteroidota bacterium]